MDNPFQEISSRLLSIEKLLQEVLSKTPTSEIISAEEDDDILTVTEAAKFLKKSVPAIYGLINRKQIPNKKPAKNVYFSKRELNEWLSKGNRKTSRAIQQEASDYLQDSNR